MKLEDDNEWRTIMQEEISSEDLRKAARFVEETILDDLTNLSDLSFPLVRGGAKDFPRPRPEDRAVKQGIDVLREDAEDAVAALYARAAAQEASLPVSDTLFAPVQPFLDAFLATEGRSASESGSGQTEGNTTA